MANAVWPVSLPQEPLLAGFQEHFPDVTVRTEMDAGPAKVRRRFEAGVTTMSVQMFLTVAQTKTFEKFFKRTIAGGAKRFKFSDPRTNATKEFRILPSPSLVPIKADRWRLSMQLEMLP